VREHRYFALVADLLCVSPPVGGGGADAHSTGEETPMSSIKRCEFITLLGGVAAKDPCHRIVIPISPGSRGNASNTLWFTRWFTCSNPRTTSASWRCCINSCRSGDPTATPSTDCRYGTRAGITDQLLMLKSIRKLRSWMTGTSAIALLTPQSELRGTLKISPVPGTR
jgi:hypothetical protein